MNIDWTPVQQALAACRRDGIAVPLWWRDDDAIAPTPALQELTDLAAATGLPVHLAVIPAHATAALASDSDPDWIIPVVHGWAHQDHSGGVGKKNEFQTERRDASQEPQRALTTLRALFGPRLRPMFVPPWNRINAEVTNALGPAGYAALSTFGPRAQAQAGKGVTQINTHIDPIWWKGTRDLVDPATLVAQTADLLHARRTDAQDPTEPLGLLTHHLVHSAAIWDFAGQFVREMLDGGATPWVMETTE